MKKNLSERRVFVLKGFTIEADGGAFFIAPTGQDTWSGPYKSLHHATTAIARKLSREFSDRNERHEKWRAQRHG